MSTVPQGTVCGCDGNVSGLPFDVPDFIYGLTGDVSPSTQAGIACKNALSRLQALGVSCQDGDGDPGNILDTLYNEELGNVQETVATEPVSNSIQKAADVALGTAAPNVAVAPKVPAAPKSGTNYALLIGFIVLLAFGFFFVFR